MPVPVSCCTLPHIMKPARLTGLHDLSLKFGICQVPPLSSKWDVSGLSQWCKENILESVRGGTGTHVRTCVGVIVSDERASLLKSRWLFRCPIGSFFVAELHSHQIANKIANPKMTPVIKESMSLFCLGCTPGRKVCALKVCAQTCLLARVNLCSVTDEAKQYFVTMLLWLDSDQTHFDYSLFFFFLTLMKELHLWVWVSLCEESKV